MWQGLLINECFSRHIPMAGGDNMSISDLLTIVLDITINNGISVLVGFIAVLMVITFTSKD